MDTDIIVSNHTNLINYKDITIVCTLYILSNKSLFNHLLSFTHTYIGYKIGKYMFILGMKSIKYLSINIIYYINNNGRII